MVSAGILLGALLTLAAVALHYSKGTGWEANEDISQEVLEKRAESVPETEFPEPMNRSIGGGGVAAGAVAGGSEGELAGGGEAEEEVGFDPDAITEDEVETYEIEFAKEGETIEVANNENILDIGEDEGWDMPYACREGSCLSCAGHIEEGPADEYIEHSNNDTLNQEEMDNGYCLTCTAYPTDSFTLETGEQP
ncbi:2Fe-2S iron-sulfur cluster-binding protein [Halorientalis sp.]|jgi:2Fe-2S type ferredoxin|uniref:2Fe-2S iron-sulfur cluster-binding protein n=1 Tax=Halorientalis sp. TaxID=1931229 RepID=UPI002619C8B6|nr:2Fe-2S iron-sulfur cluster-binding protein [Halorientalis sp.]